MVKYRVTYRFSDIGVNESTLTRDDIPRSSLHGDIGEIFRSHRQLLTVRQWSVVEAKYCFGMGEEEASAFLGLSQSAFHQHVQRATERLLAFAGRGAA